MIEEFLMYYSNFSGASPSLVQKLYVFSYFYANKLIDSRKALHLG